MPGLIEKYGFDFKDVVGIDGSPRYTALENGEAQVVDAFATDGMLKKFGLMTLEDSDGYFPPYYAIPLINEDILKEYPELRDVIDHLGEYLTDQVMQELNYQVDEEGRDPSEVARDFLTQNELI